jgi:integrase
MSDCNSTDSASADKPAKPSKPYSEFPLFAHAAGVWAKKIRGKLHYFGSWSDPDAALEKYQAEKDALHAGRKPRETTDGTTVKRLVNAYLNNKKAKLDVGELSPVTMLNYTQATDLLMATYGRNRLAADIGPDDFAELRNAMARKWGAVRVRDFVQRIRSIFKFGLDVGLLDRPARFGPGFERPSKKTIRLEKAKQGPKVFTADEIRKLLDAAKTPLKAMLLLGVNCAYGNSDCGHLPLAAVDLDKAMIDYARPKTGISRRCPLWTETVQALRDALAKRPQPKDPADVGLFFVTRGGDRWSKEVHDSPITKETRKLLNTLGINGHRNFYCLRHTFRTVADEAKDQPAADHIMGHESSHISSVYRERISDDRLRAVTDYVRAWLFASNEVTG